MQNHATKTLKTTTLFLIGSLTAYSATSSFHFSGDDTFTAPVTGSSINEVIWSDTGSINSSYTGTDAATRASTDGFYNEAAGITPVGIDQTRFGISINSTGGDVTVSSTTTSFDVTVGANVTEFNFTLAYLGQFIGSSTYNEGFTGRWSFNLDGTNHRGIAARNSTDGTAGDLDIGMTAIDFGGASSVLTTSDFFSGIFQGKEYGDAHATITGYNTTSLDGTFEQGEGYYFHNGSDLGDMLDSVTFTVTPTTGTTIAEGTIVRFTFDAMTHVPVPEPSTPALLLIASAGVLSRRKRA